MHNTIMKTKLFEFNFLTKFWVLRKNKKSHPSQYTQAV